MCSRVCEYTFFSRCFSLLISSSNRFKRRDNRSRMEINVIADRSAARNVGDLWLKGAGGAGGWGHTRDLYDRSVCPLIVEINFSRPHGEPRSSAIKGARCRRQRPPPRLIVF